MPVLLTLAANYLASEKLFNELVYETAEDDEVLFSQKIVVLVMIIGLGNILFVRQ